MRRGRLGAVIAGCLALASCGGGVGDTKTVTVAAGAPAAKTPAATTAVATTPAGDPAAGDGPVLASRKGTVDGNPVTLEVAELKRSGATTALSLRLTADSDDRSQVAETFDDGLFEKITGSGATSISGGDSLDGVYLLDATNRKKYLVGRDEQGACACDTDLGNAFVNSDGPLTLSATFGAPPAGVRAVDVFVPKYGTFKDVPLG